MIKISIQFHATLDELVEFCNKTSVECGLMTTSMVLRPFSITVRDGELTVEEVEEAGGIRVLFTLQEPTKGASSPNEFYDLNPEAIGLHFGRLTEQGLKESALVFMGEDEEKIKIANRIAARLKKLTRNGSFAINPVNGAEAPIRGHRYTDGAKALYDKGEKILPVAGNSFYKLV